MGCKQGSEKGEDNSIETTYRRHRLPTVQITSCNGDFEKEAFMTIAMFREDPKSMTQAVKDFKKHCMYTGQQITPLVSHLNTMDPLPYAKLEPSAC